jgi:hypothetical protein
MKIRVLNVSFSIKSYSPTPIDIDLYICLAEKEKKRGKRRRMRVNPGLWILILFFGTALGSSKKLRVKSGKLTGRANSIEKM